MLVGTILTAILGVGFDINFAGGSRFTYSYTGDIDTAAVKQVIVDNLGVEPTISESTDYSSNSTKLVISFAGDVTETIDQTKLEAILKEAAEAEKAKAEAESTSSEVTTDATSSTTSDVVTSDTASSDATTSDATSSTTSDTASSTTSSNTSSAEKEEEPIVSESMVGVQSAVGFLLEKNFKDNNFKSLESNTVNPTLAGAFLVKSLVAVLLAGVLVVVYIGLRFRNIGGFSAGVCAFAALMHDVIIAFFTCAICGLDIDTNFFAVALTLLGYSLNATIVIFDRVRENKRFFPQLSVREQVNKSVNETFNRSLFTALTTFVAIVSIIVVAEFFGVTALRSFAIPMAVGVVAGCFSSMFVAGPIWVLWSEAKAKREAAKAKK